MPIQLQISTIIATFIFRIKTLEAGFSLQWALLRLGSGRKVPQRRMPWLKVVLNLFMTVLLLLHEIRVFLGCQLSLNRFKIREFVCFSLQLSFVGLTDSAHSQRVDTCSSPHRI